ncbi:hypothetical protein SSX86_011944 [Deinandra increscens subsp. villosa]|uniref:Protein kinase domain-containing protein n=1 Tax=Deinandra increscens subsp. villosa TaxID=3103831 RepID=A0AAP0D7C1_9ASTR
MDAYLQKTLLPYQHLRIQLEEIISATNNFDDQKNCIGGGGFGKVYKGEMSHINGRSMVAIKRLDPKFGQGLPEFLKEITMLSNYRHENLISLLGFCCERSEMILVYELGFHGSLDRHLSSPHLSWTQRVKICIDAAKGINYLHDPRETHQRLIHCDIKSGNILLDNQWNAKVSDFGLSIMGPANEQQHSMIVTVAAGTRGYCDPQYAMTHTLTKESDVYSFGVVLFEVLCGRLCCRSSNDGVSHILVPTWIESYKKKILDDIIFKNPTIQPLDESALEIFSDIAYRCLEVSREGRPKMDEVVTELEAALETQEFSEWKPLFDYQEMTKAAEPPLNYESKSELRKLLSKGVFLNRGNTWFSLNKKAEHYEIISCGGCVVPSESESYPWSSGYNSRFAIGTYHSVRGKFKASVKSQFLSPLIAYTVNLVFKFMLSEAARKCQLISLKYKLQEEDRYSTSYFAYQREDGWWIAELYRFTSDGRIVDLDILFDGSDRPFPVIEVEGIEFRPLEEKEAEKLDTQPISYSYENWEEKLPIDYEDMLKLSKICMQSTTKKELYSIFCRGFLINVGQEWFSLDKDGKKCHMLSAKAACIKDRRYTYTRLLPESRFGAVVEIEDMGFNIASKINYKLVSSQTTYACYLIYKLQREQSRYEAPLKVINDKLGPHYIYLVSSQTPVIRSNGDQNTTHNPVNSSYIKGLPQHRDNGWMEVQIWEFQTATTTEMIPMRLDLTTCGSETLSGLIIEGVEFRPV